MNNQIEVAVEKLNVALSALESVQGVNSINQIKERFEAHMFMLTVPVVYNNQFELEYHKEAQTLTFSTTYSNQVITPQWMEQLNLLNQNKDAIEVALRELQDAINE